MTYDIENLKKRLIYRSQYRGTKEMDKLIGGFVKNNIDKLNLEQLLDLEKFLSIDDDSLYRFYNNQIDTLNDVSEELIKLYKMYNIKNNGGETGIRTQERVALCRFQDRCFQPLSHLSVSKVL